MIKNFINPVNYLQKYSRDLLNHIVKVYHRVLQHNTIIMCESQIKVNRLGIWTNETGSR